MDLGTHTKHNGHQYWTFLNRHAQNVAMHIVLQIISVGLLVFEFNVPR